MVRTLQQVGDRREFISVPDLKDARTIMLEATKVLVQHKLQPVRCFGACKQGIRPKLSLRCLLMSLGILLLNRKVPFMFHVHINAL